MYITGHALFRFIERIHGVDMGPLMVEFAILHGLPSARHVTNHGAFIAWVEANNHMNIAIYRDDLKECILKHTINVVVEDGCVVTVHGGMGGYKSVDWGKSKAWAHRLTPGKRRKVLAEIRFQDIDDERYLPMRRRSRRSTPRT